MKTKKQFIEYWNDILQDKGFVKIFPEDFLNNLDGKIIKVNFLKINLELLFKIQKNSILILENSKEADVEFTASPLDFFMYIITKGSDKFSNKIKINGDINTADKINNFLFKSKKFRLVLFKLMGKDRTERLELIFGKLSKSVNEVFEDITEDLGDFLLEDTNLFPTEKDINKFLDDVDNLKSRTEKLIKKYKNDQ
ncbi:MAG: SCP2 sterol-binding domain-containing protein [Pseudomonadota bacterium]|nr:SCP2 sterol-binding domain-containing protein [Pseudomonadota bacterium]